MLNKEYLVLKIGVDPNEIWPPQVLSLISSADFIHFSPLLRWTPSRFYFSRPYLRSMNGENSRVNSENSKTRRDLAVGATSKKTSLQILTHTLAEQT